LSAEERLKVAGQYKGGGTSVFDPVLTEIMYRWFCPDFGVILDPFAGGSVRGIVASYLRRQYFGIDLSADQVKANRMQWDAIGPKIPSQKDRDAFCWEPIWACSDSQRMDRVLPKGFAADLVFSCPPYFDLEVYSGDSRDLSNLKSYNAFLEIYDLIIEASLSHLKPNRFAIFTVGEIRSPDGFCRGFIRDTIRLFEEHGARLYNEAVLITPMGSLPLRVQTFFNKTRKLGHAHQNVLVFYKGQSKNINAVLDKCEVPFKTVQQHLIEFDGGEARNDR
jgi:hypothetical protein